MRGEPPGSPGGSSIATQTRCRPMPPNPQDIYPCLSYRDPAAAIAWLAEAFGCRTVVEHKGPDGSIVHAELALGASMIMLGSAQPDKGWISPLDLPAVNQGLYVILDDVEAHHDRARAAGAEIIRPLNVTDYGSREYAAKDLEGHHWNFGTYRPGA